MPPGGLSDVTRGLSSGEPPGGYGMVILPGIPGLSSGVIPGLSPGGIPVESSLNS